MLVDVILDPRRQSSSIAMLLDALADIRQTSNRPVRLAKGVYEIGHFSFNHELGLHHDHSYPDLPGGASPYGVCDNYQQAVGLITVDDGRPFVLSVTPIRRQYEPESGGWRWHKWGPYIGTQEPTTEYLYDEPEIELVYCYHFYSVPLNLIAHDQ